MTDRCHALSKDTDKIEQVVTYPLKFEGVIDWECSYCDKVNALIVNLDKDTGKATRTFERIIRGFTPIEEMIIRDKVIFIKCKYCQDISRVVIYSETIIKKVK